MIKTAGRPNPPWKATVLRRSRSKLGVALVEILLALAGLAGIAALLQSKQVLPSESDLKKALDKLSGNLLDPDANTIVGKYLAFVKGDYASAMPYLVHSQDKTLKGLAEHELDPVFTDNPEKKVGMADEWVAAAKKFPQLTTTFYDRASHWYVKAWPDLSDLWKMKAREQGKKLSAARPVGNGKGALPAGWYAETWMPGARPPLLDGSTARTGSYSIKVVPGDEKLKGSGSGFRSDLIAIPAGKVEGTAYVMVNGTESAEDRVAVAFYDNGGQMVGVPLASFMQADVPFWSRVAFSGSVPGKATRAIFAIFRKSRDGEMFVDDVSLKIDGKEVLKNVSFEGR